MKKPARMKIKKEDNKMKFTFRKVFFCMSCLLLQSTFTFAASEVKVGEKVPHFVLEGADGSQYAREQMEGKLIILIMGPKKNEESNNKWAETLLQAFPETERLKIFSIFDMRGIPFFISKDFIRGKVKKIQKNHPVTILMDWDQKVNKLLGADKNGTDIFVLGPNEVLLSRQPGIYSDEKLKLLRKEIIKILESGDS